MSELPQKPESERLPDRPERIRALMDMAAPILAAERGLTAAGRLKLTMLARQIGLDDDDVEFALLALLASGRRGPAFPAIPPPPPPPPGSPRGASPALPATAGDAAGQELPGIRERQERRFRRYLRKKLRKVISGVLPPDQERRLLNIAWKRHALGEEPARRCIAEIAGELRIRRVTPDDLRRMFREFIAMQIGLQCSLDPLFAHRIAFVGQTWGISRLEVQSLILEQLSANQQIQRRSGVRSWVTAAVLLVVVAGLTAALVSSWRRGGQDDLRSGSFDQVGADASGADPGPTSTTAEDARERSNMHKPGSLPGQPATAVGGRSGATDIPGMPWMNSASREALAQLRERPRVASLLRGRFGELPSGRTAACERLLDDLQRGNLSAEMELLATFFVEWYGCEPDQEPLEAIRQGLQRLALLAGTAAGTAADAGSAPVRVTARENPRSCFWALNVMRAAWERCLDNDDRKGKMLAAIERTLGRELTTANRGQPSTREECESLLSRRLLERLIKASDEQPEAAVQAYRSWLAVAREKMDRTDLERGSIDLLEAALPRLGTVWIAARELLDFCASVRDESQFHRLLRLWEKLEDPDLDAFLMARLRPRGLPESPSGSKSEFLAALRGGNQNMPAAPRATHPTGDRWRRLRGKLADYSFDPSESEQDRVWQQAANAGQLTTLALALAEGEQGLVGFDRLEGQPLRQARPKVELHAADQDLTTPERNRLLAMGGTSGFGASGFGAGGLPPGVHRQQLDQALNSLKNHDKLAPVQRQMAFRTVASLLETRDDLTAEQGGLIARYILSVRNRAEWRGIESQVLHVCRLTMVRLGLADNLTTALMARSDLQQLIGLVLDRTVEPAEFQGEMEGLRRDLLASAIPGGRSAPIRGTTRTVELAEEILRETYRDRLQIVGAEIRDSDGPAGCSELTKSMIRHWAARLNSPLATPDQRKLLERLPFELRAIDAAYREDLVRTVVFQRVALQVLEIVCVQADAQRGAAARRVVEWLKQRDAMETNLVVQLRDGEIALLRLALLFAPESEGDISGELS